MEEGGDGKWGGSRSTYLVNDLCSSRSVCLYAHRVVLTRSPTACSPAPHLSTSTSPPPPVPNTTNFRSLPPVPSRRSPPPELVADASAFSPPETSRRRRSDRTRASNSCGQDQPKPSPTLFPTSPCSPLFSPSFESLLHFISSPTFLLLFSSPLSSLLPPSVLLLTLGAKGFTM